MAGWASNSKYPFLVGAALGGADGVLRGLDRLRHHHRAAVRGLAEPHRHRAGAGHAASAFLGWYWLPLFPMFIIFFVSALAETNRPPFDLVEAESELVAGYHGRIFGVAVPAAVPRRTGRDPDDVCDDDDAVPRRLAVADPVPALHLGAGRDLVPRSRSGRVVFMFAMVKAFVPRYRYDQLMRLGWKVFLPISLVMVVVVAGVLEVRPALGATCRVEGDGQSMALRLGSSRALAVPHGVRRRPSRCRCATCSSRRRR